LVKKEAEQLAKTINKSQNYYVYTVIEKTK